MATKITLTCRRGFKTANVAKIWAFKQPAVAKAPEIKAGRTDGVVLHKFLGTIIL